MKAAILILTLLQNVPEIYTSANSDFDAGRWSEAAAKYEAVLKEDNAHIPSRFNVAVCYTKLGDPERAIGSYRILLGQNDFIYEAHVNLAILLEQTGKHDEAGEQYEKALRLRPEDGQAQLNLAMFYMRKNDLEKAYPHLGAKTKRFLILFAWPSSG